MRFLGFAVVSSAIVLGACGGSGDAAADSAAAPAPAVDSAAAPVATPPAGAAAAITGTTHEVKMVGDDKGYRFEPADITVKAGDGIKFTMISGGPHNVAFDPAVIPADVQGQLDANMSEKMGQLSSALKMNAGESITVSFANIKAGKYPYFCTPHLALGMKGEITVQ
jgi:plastocyanin